MKKKCEICHEKINYKSIFKSQLFFYFKCPKCNQKYNLTSNSKLISTLLITLPLFFLNKLIILLGTYSLLAYIIWYLSLLIIMPFFYNFEKSK